MRKYIILSLTLLSFAWSSCQKEWFFDIPGEGKSPYLFVFVNPDPGNSLTGEAFYSVGLDSEKDSIRYFLPVKDIAVSIKSKEDTFVGVFNGIDKYFFINASKRKPPEGEKLKIYGKYKGKTAFSGFTIIPGTIEYRSSLIDTNFTKKELIAQILINKVDSFPIYLKMEAFKLRDFGKGLIKIGSFSGSQLRIPSQLGFDNDFTEDISYFKIRSKADMDSLFIKLISVDTLLSGDRVEIKANALSEEYYNYIVYKKTQEAAKKNPFVSIPAIYSNIEGISGVFAGYSMASFDTIEIP